MSSAKHLCSLTVCSLQDATCDLKDRASVASDSKRIFHCKIHAGCTCSKCLQADSSPFPNTVLCDSPLQCDHTYGIDLVENFELTFGEGSGFQVAVRGWCSRTVYFKYDRSQGIQWSSCSSFPCGGTFLKPQLKQSCLCLSLTSCTGEPAMLRLPL